MSVPFRVGAFYSMHTRILRITYHLTAGDRIIGKEGTMKTIFQLFVIILLIIFTTLPASAQSHVLIGWNDLGMHCSNKDFSTFVVLPPFNNVRAQIIRVGDVSTLPAVVTANLHVTFEIPGNTYSIGKTNFWDYEDKLFGVNLPANIGLTGNGLSGDMAVKENYFYVTGIPITPYPDADLVNEDPFQLGLLHLYDEHDHLLASAPPVVPVSNEINCVSPGCHASAQAILDQHGQEAGFDPNNKPILCATCHASNALGMAGNPNVPSLSEAVHKHHGEITEDCYKCHPGPNTQCLRDVMSTQHNFVCRDCHGTVKQVGESISSGRVPWFQEPSCGASQCHGATYAEEPGKLYRESRGHGGLFCSACHGEPHAIVPSRVARDNVQNIALQGHAGTLKTCSVCHGITPTAAGPHGLYGSNCCANAGDANNDGQANVGDAVYMINYVFRGGAAPTCLQEGDANADGTVNVGDAVYLINYVFKSGPVPLCGP